MARLSPERRERILQRAQALLAEEELTLRDIRSLQHLTQSQIAEFLGIEQDSVSRMERREDMLVSTMQDYIEAMGGTLRMIAEFPDHRPYTVTLPRKREHAPRRRRAS
jgi:transcriptional regulator with XRE-family HTH domain